MRDLFSDSWLRGRERLTAELPIVTDNAADFRGYGTALDHALTDPRSSA
jgi:hypothetical protein